MNPIAVADSLSNREEHIVELATRIGRGQKKQVFDAVYKGKKQTKTVSDLASATGLTEKQVLDAGTKLVAAHAVGQTKVNGRVAYTKIAAHKAIKDKVLKAAGDKTAIEKVPTKRRPASLQVRQIFLRSKSIGRPATRGRARPKASAVKVAFILASPVGAVGINVGLDFREAVAAVQASEHRSKLHLVPFLAAHPGMLLDALNKHRPEIVHFSGHGGDEALLFDHHDAQAVGGFEVDFTAVNCMLAATDNPPKLLILAACETVDGAEQFLETVEIVIAMSASVSDAAAATFSARFYSAVVEGQSVGKAFEQAKAYMKAIGVIGADLPTLFSAKGVEPDKVILAS